MLKKLITSRIVVSAIRVKKKTTLIILGCLWLGLGCGTIKSWLGIDQEPHEEMQLPPPQETLPVDEDGNPIFADEHLAGEKKPFNTWGMIFLASFLVSTGLIVRHVIKNRK